MLLIFYRETTKLKAPKNEKVLTNQIIKLICADPRGMAYKRDATSGNEMGKPDITGVAYGVRLELEVKDPVRMSKAARALSRRLENAWEASGKVLTTDVELGLWLLVEELHSLASTHQRIWIKRFNKANAISCVVTSLFQAEVLLAVAKKRVESQLIAA